MERYLIDANLPYYFSLWQDEQYLHVIDLDPNMKDSEIWAYAKKHDYTIVTKDTDFSNMVMLGISSPRVIHIKLGNMKMKQFHGIISDIWEDVIEMSREYKLVRVYSDRVEGIG